ncbi:hypothetical protein BOW94_gp17 [Escherichia phage GA2A]|uniref:Nucleotide kinase n=1 Tax=Escherichia phage GA2A TaxID=1755695 RepID=A0A1B0TRB0_9CAUD|nr:hypothetical protein BOW94_gp17 [Escherichia phage GA2A]ALP47782.1 hypothetical protein GA2A_15 [Escherichia phage GA2A]
MIKDGDTVKYVGPLTEHMGRAGGKVLEVQNSGIAVVKWPGKSTPVKHINTALIVTNKVQSEPTTVGQDDGVRKPSHYQVFEGVESIEIIARSMTVSEFRGFCLGNVLKYRLRAGKKSELATMEKDLNKAAFYQELFDLHKGKCYAAE